MTAAVETPLEFTSPTASQVVVSRDDLSGKLVLALQDPKGVFMAALWLADSDALTLAEGIVGLVQKRQGAAE